MTMGSAEEDSETRTVWCGNLSEEVTDAILYELFNQAGPIESVRRPRDPNNGRPKSFAFILYKHECSVPYALEIFRGTKLFNRNLNLNSRSTQYHIPVLDTHTTEFTDRRDHVPQNNSMGNESRRHQKNHNHNRRESYRNESFREGNGNRGHSSSERERSSNEPKSWAELNLLRGKGSLANGHRPDLQQNTEYRRESNIGQPPIIDFNALLQMGQQMMIPSGLMAGMAMMNSMSSMGFDPGLGGSSMFPNVQGGMSGRQQHSTERDRGRQTYHERREYTREHPYNDRRQSDQYDHRRHDRGYSSSRSSHDRERRDRRSR